MNVLSLEAIRTLVQLTQSTLREGTSYVVQLEVIVGIQMQTHFESASMRPTVRLVGAPFQAGSFPRLFSQRDGARAVEEPSVRLPFAVCQIRGVVFELPLSNPVGLAAWYGIGCCKKYPVK